MDKFGLPAGVLNLIKRKLTEFNQIEAAKIYGSRAMGNYWRGSDIDIILFGNCEKSLGQIITEMDELPLPYKFDIAVYSQLTNQELKEHIDRVGINIYQRNEEHPKATQKL
jgi:predicted nucleotidyltransferase